MNIPFLPIQMVVFMVSPGRFTKISRVRAYGDVETYGHDKTFQETPNTQTAIIKYNDNKIIEMEVRGRYTNSCSA
jgi:hypothetical protein